MPLGETEAGICWRANRQGITQLGSPSRSCTEGLNAPRLSTSDGRPIMPEKTQLSSHECAEERLKTSLYEMAVCRICAEPAQVQTAEDRHAENGLVPMKAVILAGGLGTRISEETLVKPKPIVEVGGCPILWHIMKLYSTYDIHEFIVCLGYKGYMIKEYFANYFMHMSDVTFDMQHNHMEVHERRSEPWRVTLVDTGTDTNTGGRIRRILPYVKDDDAFCCTYGDGVGDIDVHALIDFHRSQKTLATLTAVQRPGRFGALEIHDNLITDFREKPFGDGGWINGGFFVLSPGVGDYIKDDMTIWEAEPMERLAHEGQLAVYKHYGFWQCMDTLRDRMYLEDLWSSGKAPWKLWK